MNSSSGRSSLLALAGGYVLYLAYELYDSIRKGTDTMPRAVTILFIVFFAVAGIAVLVYAAQIWRRGKKDGGQEQRETEQREDEMHLK